MQEVFRISSVFTSSIYFQAIKDLQNSVRDAILLLKVLLEEIERNSEKEKTAVTQLYDQLLEKIIETKTSLIQEVDRLVRL
jgi:hypothetical protein